MKKILISLLLFGWCFAQLNYESSSVTNINHFESFVHTGNAFEVANYVTLSATDTAIVVFDVADTTKYSHMKWSFNSSGACVIEVIEGGAVFRMPDTLKVTNFDRNSSNLSVMDSVFIIHNDSTLVSRYGPDTLLTYSIGGVLGGELSDGHMILANDSLLMFKMTSSAATNKIAFKMLWGEGSD